MATSNPKRVVGMHFFNPAPVLQFVEVVRTVVTEDEVFEDVKALAQRLGKQPVVVGDKAGFIANALLFGYLNHAVAMFESKYASREDIDAAMKLGCGYPMGPLALMDLIGLDTAYEILDTMYKQGRDRLHAEPGHQADGQCRPQGRKSGRGFYTYAEEGSSTVVPDHLTPKPAEVGIALRPVRAGRRRGLGNHGDRHHRGVRQGRLRRRLRRAGRVEGRRSAGHDREEPREGRPARQAHRGRPGRRARPPHRHDLARGPAGRRPRRRGRGGGPRGQARALREPRRDLQGAILAATTSSLPVVECAAVTKRPQDVVGMHFFNPAQIMRLVEVVHGLDHGRRRRHGAGPLRQGRQAPRDLR